MFSCPQKLSGEKICEINNLFDGFNVLSLGQEKNSLFPLLAIKKCLVSGEFFLNFFFTFETFGETDFS